MEFKLLKNVTILNDEYINIVRKALKSEIILCKKNNNIPFQHIITLDFIKNYKVCKAAHMYIKDLIKHDKFLGTLYYINKNCLLNPLKLEFNASPVIDIDNFDEIVNEIDNLAEIHFNPSNSNFECIKVELLYFLTLLINSHLNWVTIDFLLQCNKMHSYLILSPNKNISRGGCIDIKSIILDNARHFY